MSVEEQAAEMGEFERSGTFQDRDKFLVALKSKVEKLRSGTLAGMTESWSQENGLDIGLLDGMGSKLRFEVRESDWSFKAELPSWLPFPQSMIERMFDDAMKGLDEF